MSYDFYSVQVESEYQETEQGTASLPAMLLGPSPCDNCSWVGFCARRQTACKDYWLFVSKGKVRYASRRPTRKIYKAIFKTKDRTHSWSDKEGV